MANQGVSDSTWRSFFQVSAYSPTGWVLWAKKLRRSAELLFESAKEADARLDHFFEELDSVEPPEGFVLMKLPEEQNDLFVETQMNGVGLMLVALAIENLAKGILIARDPELVREARIPRWMGTHDLVRLVRQTEMSLSPVDRGVLEELNINSVWRGRYPIPLAWSHLKSARDRSKDGSGTEQMDDRKVGEHGLALVDRLLGLYELEVRATDCRPD